MKKCQNVIIVLNYNDFITTEKMVNKIKRYKVISKIIIVDNASSDNSFENLLTLRSEKIDVIQADKNDGYSSGNNFGIKYAEEQYSPEIIIIANPDIIVCKRAIELMINSIKGNIVASTCIMKDVNMSISKSCAWRLPTYKDILLSSLIVFKRIFYKNYYLENVKDNIGNIEVEVLPGSLTAFSKKALFSVDLYDEDTFLYNEENILFNKFKQKGYKCVLCTDNYFIHNHQTSVKKNFVKNYKIHLIVRESTRIYLKKYLKVNFIKVIIFDILTFLGVIEILLKDTIKSFFIRSK